MARELEGETVDGEPQHSQLDALMDAAVRDLVVVRTQEIRPIELQRDVAGQLVRAWLSIGIGGLLLFIASAFLAGMHPTTTTLGIAGLGALLAARGSRVVKQRRCDLLAEAAGRALPPARML